jgi:superfamily II DNA/RNA helicase
MGKLQKTKTKLPVPIPFREKVLKFELVQGEKQSTLILVMKREAADAILRELMDFINQKRDIADIKGVLMGNVSTTNSLTQQVNRLGNHIDRNNMDIINLFAIAREMQEHLKKIEGAL